MFFGYFRYTGVIIKELFFPNVVRTTFVLMARRQAIGSVI